MLPASFPEKAYTEKLCFHRASYEQTIGTGWLDYLFYPAQRISKTHHHMAKARRSQMDHNPEAHGRSQPLTTTDSGNYRSSPTNTRNHVFQNSQVTGTGQARSLQLNPPTRASFVGKTGNVYVYVSGSKPLSSNGSRTKSIPRHYKFQQAHIAQNKCCKQ